MKPVAKERIEPEVAEKWKARIDLLRRDLCREQSPTEFSARLAIDMGEGPDPIPSYVLFNLPSAVTMRDAWTVGRYAALTGADVVRLGDDRWPDGNLRYGNRLVNVEATEAWEPGRRRGDEYMAAHHDPGRRVTSDPIENWIRRADAIGPAIREAISKKAARNYAGEAELVIYVAFSEFGIRHEQVVREIRRAIAEHGSRFRAVRVIWNEQLY